MKKIFITLTVLTLYSLAGAQMCSLDKLCLADAGGKKANSLINSSKEKAQRTAEEKKENKLKDLAEKYSAAAAKDKPAIEKDLRAALLEEENKKIAFQKESITRSEEKIKALKENAAALEKNKEKSVDASMEKIKKGEKDFLNNNIPAIPALNKDKKSK